MSKRRGKRIVVGYVVSHTGKRGGPWEARSRWCGDYGRCTDRLAKSHLFPTIHGARYRAHMVNAARSRAKVPGLLPQPSARALPLVRYEVDAEEERLRDAVVDAAVAHDANRFLWLDLDAAVRALRAHQEKVGR